MKNITLLVITFTIFGCKSEQNCAYIKTGTFKYTNPIFSDWKVIRNDTLQIEKSLSKKFEVQAKINWLSECEYEMTYVNTNTDLLKKMIGKKVYVKINKVANDTIFYYKKRDTVEISSKMFKIK
ncbi:hypothetical protein [Flavobacterium selenitireducens]|uniref:hypothetical protein n=1 Tax=Flavobacterium selenitireducens TaxID=2722704 RepID=UPI00168B32B4|nr:hypothetical protein [Flavobacterium selenitireducens]MBD3583905.1 hypothetical protein [Flavobacterium selenitireducens]